jgi:prepilin-type N-terminal cleavage/methylation domain-containing protein
MTYHKTLKKGFTLIELLVVIAIIGLLSSVIMGSIASARQKAEDAHIKAELGQIHILLEQYYNDYGGYPWGPNNFYCLGGTCVFAGETGTEWTTIGFNDAKPESTSALAAIVVPNFGTTKVVTLNGYTFSGYAYLPCNDPVDSSSASSGKVCTGNSTDTSVEVISNVGYIRSLNNFALETYSYSGGGGSDGGSDSGSDSGSDTGSDYGSDGYSDYDSDGYMDVSDNCPYIYNPDQADSNGYDDYSGDGDACEEYTSDGGSDYGSDGGTDTDGDGYSDGGDNCPYVYNPDQADWNGYDDYNANGDACEDMGSDYGY